MYAAVDNNTCSRVTWFITRSISKWHLLVSCGCLLISLWLIAWNLGGRAAGYNQPRIGILSTCSTPEASADAEHSPVQLIMRGLSSNPELVHSGLLFCAAAHPASHVILCSFSLAATQDSSHLRLPRGL
jgi:hypothetical protein